jgi:hypothetical protein
MKRAYLIASVLGVALLGLAALSWAQEASVFDGTRSRIIRVCESPNSTNSDYTIYLEVRNPADGSVDNTYNVACGSAAPAAGYTTVTTTAQTDVDVSLAYNSSTATAYVFYLNSGATQPTFTTCAISSSTPPPTTYSISGHVTSGGSGLSGVSVTATGSAGSGADTTDATGYYTISGLASGVYTVTPSKSGYTFSPPSPSVTISSANKTQDFTATAQGGGCADLVITSVTLSTYPSNNNPFVIGVTVKNQGTVSAGTFVVKGYWSKDTAIDSRDVLLFTWDVPAGLGAGQSSTQSFTAQFSAQPIHNDYYLIIAADVNNTVAECNEDNNIHMGAIHLLR